MKVLPINDHAEGAPPLFTCAGCSSEYNHRRHVQTVHVPGFGYQARLLLA